MFLLHTPKSCLGLAICAFMFLMKKPFFLMEEYYGIILQREILHQKEPISKTGFQYGKLTPKV